VTERVYTFGSHRGLVGILSEPATGALRPGAPAIVFSNIGLNHRVGPNRLYVELARKLAPVGFRSLRFDLSGFGDSEPRRGGGSDLDRAILDTREAMDFLERRGVNRFVLVGLCSGADVAHRCTLKDRRIVGAIHIDGYAYPNPSFWLRHLTIRYLQPARWRRFARVRLARLIRQVPFRELDDLPEVFVVDVPPREQFTADLETLTERGVKLLFVYTTQMDCEYNYRNQFHDTFGYRDEIDVEFYPNADHVFSTEPQREMVLSRVVDWIDRQFLAGANTSETSASMPSRKATMSAVYFVGPAAMIGVTRMLKFFAESNVLSV